MEGLAGIISDFFNSIGQTRSFADLTSISGLPSEAAVERTSVDGREVPGSDICTATCDVHQKESPRPGFNPCLGLLIPPDAALTVIFESHCSGNRGTCGGDTLAAPRFRLGTEARDVLLEGALHGERTMATNILLLSTSLAMLVTGDRKSVV